MNEVVNLMLLDPGASIMVSNGATAEVISNPKDGVWVVPNTCLRPATQP